MVRDVWIRRSRISVVAALGVLPFVLVLGAPPAVSRTAPAMCHGLAATIVGTDSHDDLIGTEGPDVIQAGEGRDHVAAASGNDVVCGGPGKDDLDGGPGRDSLFGGKDSRFDQGDGAYFIGDELTGGPGDDLLVGGRGRGRDSVRFDLAPRGVEVDLGSGTAAGFGDDRLRAVERVWGSEFADHLVGRGSDLTGGSREDLGLFGQGGRDLLRGDGELQGGPGRDRLLSAGAWHAEAGAGDDRLSYKPWASDPVGVRTVILIGGPGDDLIDLAGTPRGVAGPGRGEDVVTGGHGPDWVSLSPGNDLVTTGAGNDSVGGGFGADRIRTGPGDDFVSVWCGSTDLATGGGDDVVDSGGFYTSHCAEPGDDVLVGGAGRDTLSYKGLRLFRTAEGVEVDLGAGTVTGYAGSDQVTDFEDVTGSGGSDHLTGDAGSNVLTGGNGADQIAGAGGGDILRGENGTDRLRGDDGTDTADGGDGSDSCDAESTTNCES